MHEYGRHPTHDGRTLRLLTRIEEYTRECLAIRVERRMGSQEGIETLADVSLWRGIPEYIRSDNGPEFIAQQLRPCLAKVGTGTRCIEPGSPWEVAEVDRIGAALSGRFDVTAADAIRANKESDSCDQGQTHGHKGFLLAQEEAKALMESDPRSRAVLKPHLTADEFLSSNPPAPGRYVMDFQPRSMLEARAYAEAFARIEKIVLPDRSVARGVNVIWKRQQQQRERQRGPERDYGPSR